MIRLIQLIKSSCSGRDQNQPKDSPPQFDIRFPTNFPLYKISVRISFLFALLVHHSVPY